MTAELTTLYARQLLGLLEEDELDRLESELEAHAELPGALEDLRETLDTLDVPPRPAPTGVWERLDAELSVAPPAPANPVNVRVALTCTYCHDQLFAAGASYCATCLAPHHPGCFEEHGRCSAPGCDCTLRVGAAPVSQAPRGPRRWRGTGLLAFALAGAAAAWGWNELNAPAPVAAPAPVQATEVARTEADAPPEGPTYRGKTAEDWVRNLEDYEDSYRRGAASALSGMGSTALPHVERALEHDEPHVREGALWCLAQMRAGNTLSEEDAVFHGCAALRDPDPRVRLAGRQLLGSKLTEDAVEKVFAVLGDPGWKARVAAIQTLGSSTTHREAILPRLCAALSDSDTGVREEAALALRQQLRVATDALRLQQTTRPFGPKVALPLIRGLEDPEPRVVTACRSTLLDRPLAPAPETERALVAAARKPKPELRTTALTLLAAMPGESANQALWAGLTGDDPDLRAATARALVQAGKTNGLFTRLPEQLEAWVNASKPMRSDLELLLGWTVKVAATQASDLSPERRQTIYDALATHMGENQPCAPQAPPILSHLSEDLRKEAASEAMARGLSAQLKGAPKPLRNGLLHALRCQNAYVLTDTAAIYSAMSTWGDDGEGLRHVFPNQPQVALAQLRPELAREALVETAQALRTSPSFVARRFAGQFLGDASKFGLDDELPETIAQRSLQAEHLAQGLKDEDRHVRRACAAALVGIGPVGLDHLPSFYDAVDDDLDDYLYQLLGTSYPSGRFVNAMRDPDRAPAFQANLIAGLGHPNPLARQAVAQVLNRSCTSRTDASRIQGGPFVSALIEAVRTEKKLDPLSALASALGTCAPRGHGPATKVLLEREAKLRSNHNATRARSNCLYALNSVSGEGDFEAVRAVLIANAMEASSSQVRSAATNVLGNVTARWRPTDDVAIGTLFEVVHNDVHARVRQSAARALGVVGTAAARTPGTSTFSAELQKTLLRVVQDDGDGDVRAAADDALRRIRRTERSQESGD